MSRDRVVDVGEAVSGNLIGGARVVYRLVVQAGQTVNLFISTEGSESGTLGVEYPTTGGARASSFPAGIPSLDISGTGAFLAVSDTLNIEVISRGYAGTFRMRAVVLDAQPETSSATLSSKGQNVAESVQPPGDSDLYFVQNATDDSISVNAMLSVLSVSSGDSLVLRALRDGSILGSVAVAPGASDSALLGRLKIGSGSELQLEVSGNNTKTALGSYQLSVLSINPLPESADVDLTHGMSVSEGFESPGDIDEFSVTLAAGALVRMFVDITDWSPADSIVADVVDPHGRVVASTTVTGADGRVMTTRFPINVAGHHRFRLGGSDGRRTYPKYSFWTHLIDPKPEDRDSTVSAGDTIVGGIEYWDDVDAFALQLSHRMIATFVLDELGGTTEPLDLTLQRRDQRGIFVGETSVVSSSTVFNTTGRTTLFPGDYRLVANNIAVDSAGYTGSYRIIFNAIDSLPETTQENITWPDTVFSETMAPIGDIDRFTFANADTGVVLVDFRYRTSGTSEFVRTWALPSMRRRVSCLPYLGWNSCAIETSTPIEWVTVTGPNGGILSTGDYDIGFSSISQAPEILPPAIMVGDTLRAETLYRVGDVDTFFFDGQAGDNILIHFRLDGTVSVGLVVEGPDGSVITVVPSDLAPIPGTSDVYWAPRLTLPSTGTYRVLVNGRLSQNERSFPGFVGSYQLAFHLIDPSPETLSSSINVDTHLVGEEFETIGDIDVFEFQGTAGEQFMVTATLGGTSLPGVVGADVTPRTSAPLRSVLHNHHNSGMTRTSLVFTLLETGTHYLTMYSSDLPAARGASGPYSFSITRVSAGAHR